MDIFIGLIRWFCPWAVTGGNIGLIGAILLARIIPGMDQGLVPWLLAGAGFALGLKHDYETRDVAGALAATAQLLLVLSLMAIEAALVLSALGPGI